MLRISFRLLLALVLTLPLAACDSNDGDGDGDGGGGGGGTMIGSATITVSGSITSSFSGSAVFGVDENDNTFSLALFEGSLPTSGAATGALIAIGRNEERPAVGTYNFRPSREGSDFVGAYIDSANPGASSFVASMSGTLTITSSSSDRVAGSFSFTGQGSSSTGPLGEATVSGDFSAEFASNVPASSFP